MLNYYTRLLDVDLYAKTRTRLWFTTELRCYAVYCYAELLCKAIGQLDTRYCISWYAVYNTAELQVLRQLLLEYCLRAVRYQILLISQYAVHSTAEVVAAEVAAAGVLPEGGQTLGAINKLGVLALSKEVVLGVNLRVVKCLIHCVFNKYSKLASVGCCRSCQCGFCCQVLDCCF